MGPAPKLTEFYTLTLFASRPNFFHCEFANIYYNLSNTTPFIFYGQLYYLYNHERMQAFMKEFKYVITDPVGIHARPAGLLVKEAKNFKSTATFIKGEKSAKATALMKLMGMGIKQGDEVTIQVEGEDEDTCAAALEKFMKENF